MASPLTSDLGRHIAVGDSVPLEFGKMDCSLWAADWVRLRTGIDLADAWRGQYRTRRDYMRMLLAEGSLIRVADRALTRRLRCPRIAPEAAKMGDIGIVVTTDGPALAVRGRNEWLAKTGDKLSRSPAASYAWSL